MLEWRESLKFSLDHGEWRGRVTWLGHSVAVVSKHFEENEVPAGAAPPAPVAAEIERRVATALDNYDRDMEIIVGALTELYNQHWKPADDPTLSVTDLQENLQLLSVSLMQGERSDNYAFRFEDQRRFRGYIPFTQSDGVGVLSVSLVQPWGPDGPLLPYPSNAQAKLPPRQTPEVNTVPPTDRVSKIKWISPLSYKREHKNWQGSIAVRRKQIEIQIDAMESDPPVTWADVRLGRILPCIVPATEVAAQQIRTLYNDDWRDGRELSAAGVKRRIHLQSIHCAKEGPWSLWFADGDLFAGHWIRVDVDDQGKVNFELLG